ncbi:hypothetical protein [Spiroplasma endosymbiont of Tricholauxania praeusta]|uniref:hypothetical protein n=1 Tax=Spiroplasma endosymbiont of Tricholauxania praeusta TaxID=3066296 RepID=UPI0030D50E34
MTNKINKSIPEYIAPLFNDPVVLNNDTFNFKFENNFWIFMAQNRIHIYLCIWHDDNNIYCQYAGHNSSQFCASGSSYDINLESITFHNLSDSSVLLNKKRERTEDVNNIQICLKIIKLDENNFDFNMQLYVNLNTCKILVNNNTYFVII